MFETEEKLAKLAAELETLAQGISTGKYDNMKSVYNKVLYDVKLLTNKLTYFGESKKSEEEK